ncbi:AlpA family phage regulatory protein [Shewanella sp. 4t3-1-2LB]|jgi:predicted DNA-binding transcriptional regulator AlpA|uniref:helix-turn-helix transcriptional regulator n=1 Tax=Shewanella sp. 4t3-1-2LB TaxID=2817682 RepID=UPI001A98DD04|nr:AlpA family phage regulatory protein [Shewanella sp. 4t3-1-2LB]MBO1270843.1 AlpA family phage regulatory protein [Shewanella sp. 4t3-1-2LB]
MAIPLTIQPEDRFVREAERKAITSVSRTTAWSLERQGLFPRRRKLHANSTAVGWLLSELVAWVRNREIVLGNEK